MNVIQASELKMVYGADEVFRGVNFNVLAGERIGIVGANGAGKSTLLRLIAGELEPSGGRLVVGGDLKCGYLKQSAESDGLDRGRPEDGSGGDERPEDGSDGGVRPVGGSYGGVRPVGGGNEGERPEGGGYEGERSVGGDYLSGGERAKRALETILSGLPDILLLDEPTNHLDFERLEWLEGRIRHFKGTILLVSHDRYFLDRTVTRIFDMGGGGLKTFKGNYSAFREKKAALEDAAEKAYLRDIAEYKRQEDMIRKMKERGTEKLAKRAASREKKLAREHKPDVVRVHNSEGKRMHIRFAESRRSGDDVLIAEGLSKSFGERLLFENVDLDIKRDETVCMVGANGVGKTTFFRILAGRLGWDAGYFERGAGVRIGYYDQHQENLTGSRTLLEEMRETFPALDDTVHRSLLGAFLFHGDKVFQRIETLSGGEKARLSLLKLIKSGANTLLLDEPTNHLDIASMEVVESALKDFPGTLFIISHDRYLLETLPDRIVELTTGGLENYPGKFDYYFEKRRKSGEYTGLPRSSRHDSNDGGLGGWEDYKPETNAARERRLAKEAEAAVRRKERQIAETEKAIDEAEEKIAALETGLADPKNATDHELLAKMHLELTETGTELELLLTQWETLHTD
jgi:ATP-binding cassette subfamily F protein 3